MKIYATLLITYIGFFLTYALNKYLTTHLNLDGLGDFKVGLSVASILAIIINFGGNGSLKRFIPKYFSNKDFASIAGLIRFYFRKILQLSLILLVLYIIAYFVIKFVGNAELEHEAMEAVLLTPLIALSMLIVSGLQARYRPIQSILSHRVLEPLIFLFLCYCWLHFWHPPNINEIIILFTITTVSILLIQSYFFNKTLPFNLLKVKPLFHVSEWKKVGFPLLYSTVANTFLVKIDTLALEVIHPDEKAVGIFTLLIFIVSLIKLNYSSILSVITPGIAVSEDRVTWQKIYNKGFLSMLTVNLIASSILIIFANDILLNFGEEMLPYKNWLIILLSAEVINRALEVSSAFLRFTGHQKQAKDNSNLVMVLNLVSCPILVFFYGMPGAMVSLIITRFVRAFNYSRLMKKHVGIKPLIIY